MVELSNLTLGYNEKKIITNFSFKFEVGKLYAISGPSGIGKTTLLNAIGGILKPLEGNIYYNMPMNLSKDVTFVYQDTSLIDSLTVLQNIKLMLILAGVKFKKTAILEVLDKLNVLEYLNTKIKFLSGGERQRINIAIAILRDSKIILCDEPDSSLDEDNIRKIMKILKELALTKLVIFTSHKQKALEYADEIISPNSSNESYELTAKYKGYHKINLKAFLYIYFKGLKGKIVSFIFSLIIFSLMIFVSSYFYSLGHYDKSKSLINELNENEGTSLLIKARTDTLKENNLDFSYYSKIKITGEELGILNSSDEIFNGVVIDDTLGDDEIMVTDYSLRLLRKNNLLSFSTYNECVGSDIHITYKKNNLLVTKNLKIKKYLSTNYDKINPSYSNNDIYTKLMYVNASTYYQLFYNTYKKQAITLGTDKYKLMTSNQYNLLYNEAIIGSDVLSYWQSQGYDISFDNKSSIKLYVNDMEITTNLSIKYNEMVEGIYVNEATKEGLDETFFVKYYSLYDEFKVFLVTKDKIKTIALLYFNGSEIEFINSDNFFKALAEIDDDNALFEILKVGLIALTLTIVFLSYYSFCKVNNVRFQILELYGLPKRNRPLMLLIGNLASSIISFLISFSMLYNIFNQKDNVIKNKYFLNSFYSLFSFKYMLYVYLIVLGIIVGVFAIFVPFIFTKKRYSYISK